MSVNNTDSQPMTEAEEKEWEKLEVTAPLTKTELKRTESSTGTTRWDGANSQGNNESPNTTSAPNNGVEHKEGIKTEN
ncbi:hypothetical protein X797_011469 [Metarhizium robertsii]|uniref:Uncharacterized protein n=1 Tax=Metarhizium robertsii TaxID=568076 RepID=A0A014P2A1_9HYPO|nr:hypothetical protein X797_011469 [Metarhizium robertsii]